MPLLRNSWTTKVEIWFSYQKTKSIVIKVNEVNTVTDNEPTRNNPTMFKTTQFTDNKTKTIHDTVTNIR